MSKTSIAFAAALLAALLGLSTAPTPASAGTGCLPGSIKAKLAQIRQKFGPIRVISTHRPGARIAGSGKRSYHASCRAVDFHAPKGKYRQVVNWLKSTHSGGVGTYSCGMHHIHIDNGPRVRFHHCVNARGKPVGKKKRYAKKRSRKSYAKKSTKRTYAKSASKKSGGYASRRVSRAKQARAAQKKRSRQASNPWGITKYATN